MQHLGTVPNDHSLDILGIHDGEAHWNLPAETLIRVAAEKENAMVTSTGAIAVHTGEFTGRSPKDRFIVQDNMTRNQVWWNHINQPFDAAQFNQLVAKAGAYLNGKTFYVRDVYACADPRYRVTIRVITEYAWSNLFAHNMFLRPEADERLSLKPEWTILCVPGFQATDADGTRQHNFSILDFSRKLILIGGSAYTGEIKKGMFSALNFLLPTEHNVLPMHCSANVGPGGDVALFFGLSGTGKTTLSADPDRPLIGDDEHGWTPDNVIFNFEGGCYAKVIGLEEQKEPAIYKAIRKGAMLENVVFKPGTNEVDYRNGSITENTRVSYPLDHMDRIVVPSIGKNPTNIFFLTCDADGVLPPIARLNPGQAAYHFISGYTAKVAGTEAGVVDPVMTFSACFGAPFMPLHPTVYAEMLSEKIRRSKARVWLVNTGWTGGPYGVGRRMSLAHTRLLINRALDGSLDGGTFTRHEVFGVDMPDYCAGVPEKILNPRRSWQDTDAYDKRAATLAAAFTRNFEQFAAHANEEILAGGPGAPVKVLTRGGSL